MGANMEIYKARIKISEKKNRRKKEFLLLNLKFVYGIRNCIALGPSERTLLPSSKRCGQSCV